MASLASKGLDAGSGFEPSSQLHKHSRANWGNNMTPIDNALGRLQKVRQRQPGQWSARCPAHNDKGPSLSIRETTEGGVLLHCFAGCATTDVVSAMGLELSDLFPPRFKSKTAPRRIANLLTAGQAIDLLATETTFVSVALTNQQDGKALTPQDIERLRLATGRINLMKDQMGRHHA
jgi:hypothetical protein